MSGLNPDPNVSRETFGSGEGNAKGSHRLKLSLIVHQAS
jgi:hypothetical protein